MRTNKLNAAIIAGLAGLAGLSLMRNDTMAQLDELQNRLLTLNETARSIQAKVEAEKREMTVDEAKEINEILAAFEDTEVQIERLQRLEAMNKKITAPIRRTHAETPRNEEEEPRQTQNADRSGARQIQSRTPRIELVEERGRWGFRSFGEFATSVVNASAKGGAVDPRLIANAPTTFGQEGSGADGGFAVPPEFRQAIMVKVMGEDSLLGMTDQQITSSNSLTVPKDETTPWQTSGGIQAYWEGEAAQFTQSKPALQNLTTKANKLTALVPVTDELLEDAASMTNYLNKKAPDKINFKITDALINGTGAGQPLGILNSGPLISVAKESGQANDTVVFANINKMWARMYAPCRKTAVWLINQDLEPQLQNLQITGSNSGVFPVYMPPGGLSGSPYATLLGRPILVTEACQQLGAQGDIIFADLNSYLSLTKAGGLRADISIHLWFDYDITAFRFIIRVGGQPWWTTSIARKNGSNTLSCFTTLAARGP